jgi:hypothetical protein
MSSSSIGLLNEKPLHADLKRLTALPGDRFEVPVDRFVVDIVRDDLLLEIQTASFGAMRSKLRQLLKSHQVRLIYPLPVEKWIVTLPSGKSGETSRRKSPKRGRIEHAFIELVSIPDLISNPNFSFEIVMTREEELRKPNRARSWRRKNWRRVERQLVDIVERRLFATPDDWRMLAPISLNGDFTTQDLATEMNTERYLAQKMAYCYAKSGLITQIGKQGRSWLYRWAESVTLTSA